MEHKFSDGIDADNDIDDCEEQNINTNFTKKNVGNKNLSKSMDSSKEEEEECINNFPLNDYIHSSTEKLK